MSATVIDFHVHPFDGASHNLNMFPGAYDLNIHEAKDQLERAGITHICGSVLQREHPVESFEDLRELNREALRLKEILGDFYTPGFHIHPAYVRESCDEIEFMHGKGIRLIGELVPYMHNWNDFDAGNWMEIMDVAEQYHMVCSYHTPFEFDMDAMLRSHPGVNFVAAHPGDRVRIPGHIEMLKKYENLYLDLSGTGLFRFGVLKHLVQSVGSEKLLFGTDYPICNPRMYVEAVCGEEISEKDREAIFRGNAERILTGAVC